jgi:hypothetical protein
MRVWAVRSSTGQIRVSRHRSARRGAPTWPLTAPRKGPASPRVPVGKHAGDHDLKNTRRESAAVIGTLGAPGDRPASGVTGIQIIGLDIGIDAIATPRAPVLVD